MLTYSSTRDAPTRPNKLRFGLLSPEEVRRMAVVRVVDTTLYYRGLPNSGGLLDPLMGSVDRRHLCASCMRDAKTCQGHIGYIELAYPMYHIGFIETVIKVLRTVCFACSRLCATEEDIASVGDMTGRTRHLALHSLLRGRKTCPHCKMTRPSYSRLPLGIKIEWPSDMEWECEEEKEFCNRHFTAREVLSILRHMKDEDCTTLGFHPKFSHPKNMILETLVVPPPFTRPAIYASEGSRSRGQNDLTVRLLDCLKRSIELETSLDKHWKDVPHLTNDHLDRIAKLQYEVFSIVNNNVKGYKPVASRGSHQQKTLSMRLKGKDGRVRGNLMGKRVDFSSRCVITPDPYFACDRVGIPYSIAKVLTVPEIVNAINVTSLTKRVQLGANHVKGAQTIIHLNGDVTHLSHCVDRSSITLKFGDVVERNLDDDDVVVFNRQPSLHKHGMQGHRVRLMEGRTFRLSLVVAAPYNADFDGDEMNVHVPQSVTARAEVAALLAVPQNVIGPQSNKPTMGIVQDSLLGLHLLTLKETVFGHADCCRIIGSTLHVEKKLPAPCIVIRRGEGEKERFWSGKQIFSTLLNRELYVEPDKVNLETVKEEDSIAVVRGGELLCGVLKKAHVGTAAGGIVDVISRDFGGYDCCRFFDDAQRMTHSFLLIRGHEVGIHDVILSGEGQEKVTERLSKATHLCEEIQKEVSSPDVPSDVVLTAERSILRLLSKTLTQCGSIANEYMDDRNAIRRMVNSGSKGTFINLSQISAALGQQSLEGARIVAEKGERTLPCFKSGDLSLASRGFITNSYALGLSPTDVFFHAIGGREGLVDTAVKTSQTGYLQRRMNKSFEDHVVQKNGHIMNALGEIISFCWGSDGLHPAYLERVRLAALLEEEKEVRRRMKEEEAALFFEMRRDVLLSKANILESEMDARVLLPFNTMRVKKWIERLSSKNKKEKGERVDGEEATRRAMQMAKRAPKVVGVAILDLCCEKSVRFLSPEDYEKVMSHVETKLDEAVCPTGESVGCIAAQSTGEPCTQMTLNSVDWNTTMVIHWKGKTPPPAPHDAEVGAFIDALIEERGGDCQLQPDGKTIYLPLPKGTAVALSPDENGKMVWTELEAVTRHPPINKDGSNTLVEVTTDSGRKVVVTKGKSLLVERMGKLVEMEGDKVRVGDRVPVVQHLRVEKEEESLDLHTVFKETEAIFTNTMIEAVEAAKLERRWFMKGGFKSRSFYTRSDNLKEAIKDRPSLLQPNLVTLSRGSLLPEKIPLDRDFGFFVGAYLAEGCLTEFQVHISNVDEDYRNAAKVWPERHGIHSHVTNEKHRSKNNGTSISIMFHSTLLVQLMERTCGKMSAGKRVPGFAFSAPKPFVCGLLDGYMSGDGFISKTSKTMHASSRSIKLRDGIALLLTRFGIECTLRESLMQSHIHWKTEEDGTRTQTKYGEKTPIYTLKVPLKGTRRFAEEVNLVLKYKQDTLEEILNSLQDEKRQKTYPRMKDVRLEEIVDLKDIPSSHEFVYDLTVEETRNMTALNGVGSRDTFHSAGIASKNVTLGIPKLKELIDASKSPKTPFTQVRFRSPYSSSESFAEYFSSTLPLTRLTDVVSSCDVIFDPDPSHTVLPEDAWIVDTDFSIHPDLDFSSHSNHVFRMVLHRETMRVRMLTPPSVRSLLQERLGDRAHVVSSETNSIEWVLRVRFAYVKEMVEYGGLASDQEAILVHRTANVLLDTTLVSGHPHVTTASMSPAKFLTLPPEEGAVVSEKEEFTVVAYGTFFQDCAASEVVDWYRCTSNDVWEVYNTLGIEACSHVLFDQLKTVISFDGQYVDDRHLSLIVDSMCRSGKLVPLNRHGINRADTSPLMRASFEETIDVLCDAAVYAETENAKGVTTSIMTGQLSEFGSGVVDALFHESCVSDSHKVSSLLPCNTTKKKRVFRSTCRSFISDDKGYQNVEYVYDDCKSVGREAPPLPSEVGETYDEEEKQPRRRARFRPVSPTK